MLGARDKQAAAGQRSHHGACHETLAGLTRGHPLCLVRATSRRPLGSAAIIGSLTPAGHTGSALSPPEYDVLGSTC